jgi:hypothetical protein
VLILIFLLKVKVGETPLINYSLDVFAVIVTDAGGDLQRDGVSISTFSHELSLQIMDYHSGVESVVDCACGGEVNSCT